MQRNVQRSLEIHGVVIAYTGYRAEVGLKFPYFTSYLLTLHSFQSTYSADSHLWGCVANGAAEMSCIRSKPLSRKSCMAQAAEEGWEGCGPQSWEVLSGEWERELLGLAFSWEPSHSVTTPCSGTVLSVIWAPKKDHI